MRGDCRCYTQQGTLLQTSRGTCMQIVNHGFFMDWEEGGDGKGKDKNEGEEHQPQREPLMAQDHSAKESTMPRARSCRDGREAPRWAVRRNRP